MGSFSIWHWLVLLALICLVVLPIHLSASRARAEKGVMAPGFKGWLLLFAVMMWLRLIRALVDLAQMFGEPLDARFPLLSKVDLLVVIAVCATFAWSLLLMSSRAAGFPRAFAISVVVLILSFPVAFIAGIFLLVTVYGQSVDIPQALVGSGRDIGQWLGAAFWSLVWLGYVRRSRRVAMTFTR